MIELSLTERKAKIIVKALGGIDRTLAEAIVDDALSMAKQIDEKIRQQKRLEQSILEWSK